MFSIRCLCRLVLCLGAAALGLTGSATPQGAAWDGRPGLAVGRDQQQLLRVWRNPDREDQALLAGLDDLQREVPVLIDNAAGLADARGYFALLDPAEAKTLAQLALRFGAAAAEPWKLPREPQSDQRLSEARAYFELQRDTRMRARLNLVQGAELELADLRRALALLRQAANGYADLREAESQTVARRADLAAATLRALRSDLEALRENAGTPVLDPDPNDRDWLEWLDAINEPGLSRRRDRVQQLASVELGKALAMETMLASTRLSDTLVVEREWRANARAHARTALAEARRYNPLLPEGHESDPALERMSQTQRFRASRSVALAALQLDPLDAELTYAAAAASRVVWGTLEALSLFDRYLSLRGMRFEDSRTYDKRQLTPEEQEALLYLQQYQLGEIKPVPPPLNQGD